MDVSFTRHGFFPHPDPLTQFPTGSELSRLDELGRDLASLLEDKNARDYLRSYPIPHWPADSVTAADIPALRLYYVRLGFVASGYVNQIGPAPATVLRVEPIFVGDLWVLAGQSNMEGVGNLTDVTPPSDRVMLLGMDGRWGRAYGPVYK